MTYSDLRRWIMLCEDMNSFRQQEREALTKYNELRNQMDKAPFGDKHLHQEEVYKALQDVRRIRDAIDLLFLTMDRGLRFTHTSQEAVSHQRKSNAI